MIQSIGRICTVAALCAALGLHWFLIQTVAWTSMVVKYSQRAPFSAALVQTFDGNHPCSLCKAVQNGKGSEKKNELRPVVAKIDLIASLPAPRIAPPFRPHRYGWLSQSFVRRISTPPLPPPRFALS